MKSRTILPLLALLGLVALFTRYLGIGTVQRSLRNSVVIAFYFNHKADPQREAKVLDLISYSKSWAESVYANELKGMIFTNHKNKTASDWLRLHGVELVYVDVDAPIIQDNLEQTTVDMKFIVASAWVNAYKDLYDYIVITDLHDVEVLDNPFPFFAGYDEAMGEPQMYIGSEVKGSLPWMRNYWWNCYQEELPKKYLSRSFYNPGLMGGKSTVLNEYLGIMTIRLKEALRINPAQSCDMQATWMALDQFQGRTFTGFPLHTVYKNYTYLPGALLKHK
jgi:hypothetical protein